MSLSVVAGKDFAAVERRGWTYVVRAVYVGVLTAVVWNDLALDMRRAAFAATGRNVFLLLVGAQFIMAALLCPMIAADSITGERRRGTLPLLAVSAIRPVHIVLGKVAACVFAVGLTVAATVPLMMMTTLYGGVSVSQVGLSFVYVVATLVTTAALGVLFSARLKNHSGAGGATLAATVVWLWVLPSVLPSGVARTIGSLASPWCCFTATVRIGLSAAPDPMLCLLTAGAITILALAAAVYIVSRTSVETPSRVAESPLARTLARFRRRPSLDNMLFWETSGLSTSLNALAFMTFRVMAIGLLLVGIGAYALRAQETMLVLVGMSSGFCWGMVLLLPFVCTRFILRQKMDGTLAILLTTPTQEAKLILAYLLSILRMAVPMFLTFGVLCVLQGASRWGWGLKQWSMQIGKASLTALCGVAWVCFLSLIALCASAFHRSYTAAFSATLLWFFLIGYLMITFIRALRPFRAKADHLAGLSICLTGAGIVILLLFLARGIRSWNQRV